MDLLTELVSQLIAIPSVNPMGRPVSGPQYHEKRLTLFLEEWLKPLGLHVRRQAVAKGCDNLLATFPGRPGSPHVLLEVHQDTVPTDHMTIDPFKPFVRDGRIYGRGACDNKGPMTAMLLAMRRLALEKPAEAATVTLALTVDEEYSFAGAISLAEDLSAYDGAIVAEPTDLDMVVAHKGVVRWALHTTGRACHAATPQMGVNALYPMARVLQAVEAEAEALASQPGHPLVGPATLNAGVLTGGVSPNVVPDNCELRLEQRMLPGEQADTVWQTTNHHLQARLPAGLTMQADPPFIVHAPLDNQRNKRLTEAFEPCVQRHYAATRRRGVPFGTDASEYAKAGLPSLVFGPGSIAQAHTADEWIELAQIAIAAEVYYDFCKTAGNDIPGRWR